MSERTRPLTGAGSPAPYGLVAAFLVASLVCFLLSALSLLGAADDLARGALAAPSVLLAVHLLALGFLPLAVGGAVLHVLPLMLRGVPHAGRGWATLAGLCAGPLAAVGIARHEPALTWPAVAFLLVGFGLLLGETVRLVVRAPRGKLVVVSRFGVCAAGVHGALSLLTGPVLFTTRWRPWAGVPHESLIAIHLHLAVLGCLTLLILAVGRTLAPMLAVAPVAPRRRLPVDELLLTIGVWLAVVGFATGLRGLLAAGTAASLLAVGRFLALVVRTARGRRVPAVEGPLAHFLVGLVFLAQSAVLAVVLLARGAGQAGLTAYALSLLLGWAAGVTLGHVGKLLAMSAWAHWPPGPRPKQAAFYDGPAWTAEVVAFALGVALAAAGVLAESPMLTRVGAGLLVAAALLALRGALATLSLSHGKPGSAVRGFP